MFGLLYGHAIDTLTLARNERTSSEMIDRFYAAPLQGEFTWDCCSPRATRGPRSFVQRVSPTRAKYQQPALAAVFRPPHTTEGDRHEQDSE
jgi:hypothetical protein